MFVSFNFYIFFIGTNNSVDLFSIIQVLEDVIPTLKAPILSIMDCVEHLVTEGDDMAAGSLYTPFTKFCEIEKSRPIEVLEIVKEDNEKWINFISPAIVAGSNIDLSEYVDIAIQLSSDENLSVRVRAIFALGRINYCHDKTLLTKALETLKHSVQSETDDQLLANILRSVFVLFEADNSLEKNVEAIIEQCLLCKGDEVLHQASELLWRNTNNLSSTLRENLLNSLGDTNPNNKGTLNIINYALKNVVDLGEEERTTEFIEKYLIKNPEISIETFQYLTRRVYENDRKYLNMLVTRWFLSKEYVLGKAVVDILGADTEGRVQLSVDLELLKGLPEGIRVFLTRKAVGWLYTKPLSAVSFIISLIDTATDDELEQIEELLFDPLLISYGKVKDYFEKRLPNKSEIINSVLSSVLAKLNKYQDGLRIEPDIPELLPPQSHRETHSRHFSQLMAISKKEAESKSVFSGLFKHSVLLYGRTSIHYMQMADEKPQRSETVLQKFSHSFDIPTLGFVDPFGLDYMLRVYRNEGCN